MKPGGKLKKLSGYSIEHSIKLRNSKLESLSILIIMSEEKKECFKEREKDGQTTTHISLEVLLKKNSNIETILKLISKKIQKIKL